MATIEIKTNIFVCYHREIDQNYFKGFSRYFDSGFEIVKDRILDRAIDRNDSTRAIRRIRQNLVARTDCTVVFCGPSTPECHWIDWEIQATLEARHGLIGIRLPTYSPDPAGNSNIPPRLLDNIQSGYALWVRWKALDQGSGYLFDLIETATSKQPDLISNRRVIQQPAD